MRVNLNATLNGVKEMKRQKFVFIIGLLLAASLIFSACQMQASTGEVTPQDDSELQDILDAVAQQTPAGVDDGTGGNPSVIDSLSQTQTAQAGIPTPELPSLATPTPSPTPTRVPVEVDKTVPEQYTLKKGEFPWCIARRFNIDPITLLNANGLSGSQYDPGLVLKIPANPGKFDGNPMLANHPTTYTVKSGDTFYSIACVYGDVWPEEIAAQNGMDLTDSLTAGTTLDIP